MQVVKIRYFLLIHAYQVSYTMNIRMYSWIGMSSEIVALSVALHFILLLWVVQLVGLYSWACMNVTTAPPTSAHLTLTHPDGETLAHCSLLHIGDPCTLLIEDPFTLHIGDCRPLHIAHCTLVTLAHCSHQHRNKNCNDREIVWLDIAAAQCQLKVDFHQFVLVLHVCFQPQHV